MPSINIFAKVSVLLSPCWLGSILILYSLFFHFRTPVPHLDPRHTDFERKNIDESYIVTLIFITTFCVQFISPWGQKRKNVFVEDNFQGTTQF